MHIVGSSPNADTRIYLVKATTKQAQHLSRMFSIARLAKNLTGAFGNRVGSQNDPVLGSQGDFAGLLQRESRHNLLR
jgi:hypothetical protein